MWANTKTSGFFFFFLNGETSFHDRQHVVSWVIPGDRDNQGLAKIIKGIAKRLQKLLVCVLSKRETFLPSFLLCFHVCCWEEGVWTSLNLGKEHPESSSRKPRENMGKWNIGKRNRDEQRYGKKKKKNNPDQKCHFLYTLWWRIWELLYSTHGFLSLDAHSSYVLLTISSWSSCLVCCWRLPGPLCAGQHTVCCCCHLLVIFNCSAMGIHILSATSLLCTYQHYTCHLLDRRFWKLVNISLLL